MVSHEHVRMKLLQHNHYQVFIVFAFAGDSTITTFFAIKFFPFRICFFFVIINILQLCQVFSIYRDGNN